MKKTVIVIAAMLTFAAATNVNAGWLFGRWAATNTHALWSNGNPQTRFQITPVSDNDNPDVCFIIIYDMLKDSISTVGPVAPKSCGR